MKLKSVRVMNYRNIEDSGEFAVGPLTCLVGKNESGKTALLTALERTNPFNPDAKFNIHMDYPRTNMAKLRQLRQKKTPVEVVRTVWEMEDHDVKKIEEAFFPGCLTGNTFSVTHTYTGSRQWGLPLDDKKVVHGLLVEAGLSVQQSIFRNCSNTVELHKAISKMPEEYANHSTISALREKVETYAGNSATLHTASILGMAMPKFLYFSHYGRMSGAVSFNALKHKVDNKISLEEGERVFLDFLGYANMTLDEIQDLTNYEQLKSTLEGVSNEVTDKFFEYWSQNTKLAIEFEIAEGESENPEGLREGKILYARVGNKQHNVSVPFSERSAGFVWFFSFIVHFTQIKEAHGKNLIILLDEPGLTLHAKAQGDLLRYINEKLLPHHQVLYTTHSPFMIPNDNWPAVKVVEDIVEEKDGQKISRGGKVSQDILETTAEAIFPLQAALGYEITQTLFVGKNVLLVEGPSDFLYLRTVSTALGKAGLSQEWTICPAGGIDKISPFVSLFSGDNKLRVAALTDYAKGMKGKFEKIRQSAGLHVHTYADFCDLDEADVEDVFGAEFYAEMVNKALELKEGKSLSPEKFEAGARVVKEVELRLPGNVEQFDHYIPANWLAQNPGILEDEIAKPAMERFGKIFQTYNNILKRMKSENT